MIRFGRLLLLAAFALSATAPMAVADFDKLLEPVQGGGRRTAPPSGSAPGVAPLASSQATAGSAPAQAQAPLLLTEGELLAAIERDLPKRYFIQGELRVSLVRPWVALQLQSPDFFAECVQLPPSGLASNMPVIVRGVSGGKIVAEWPLQLKVQVWQDAWVAPQRFERGQVLSRGMLTVQKMDILREPNPLITEEQDISGFELAQAVQQGRPITRRDLVERTLIKKGQFVDAIANEGALSMRMRAVAVEGGPAGAVIRVRNLDTRKEFFAQVINENQVQVRF
ncbi:MAG: Flagella basal body P-ring formation protein FlgA [Verrucomicrobia bacterium]|nr:MAG: Flagella basal body P-ring formation protein FlgA [Verrucomicrobiota bacterium]